MRYPDWQSRLNKGIQEARNKEYKIGKHDCALFAARIIKDITGRDFLSGLEGKYSSRRESLLFIREVAGAGLKEAVSKFMEQETILVSFATQGDLMLLIDFTKMEHLGICIGKRTAFLTDSGLCFFETLDCEWAWRV